MSGMRCAYADPPYLGSGKAHYSEHPDAAACDDLTWHEALIDRLGSEFPDGWALSASSDSLREILPLCPQDCRVAAWIKPFVPFVKKTLPAYSWEPVIYRGGRKRKLSSMHYARDSLVASWRPGMGLVGAKPRAFCFWMFELLGLEPADEFHDLFPGSKAVSAAWAEFCGEAVACDAPLFAAAGGAP